MDGLGLRRRRATPVDARAWGGSWSPRARRLYELLGYRHVPDRDITVPSSSEPGRFLTLVSMVKPLG